MLTLLVGCGGGGGGSPAASTASGGTAGGGNTQPPPPGADCSVNGQILAINAAMEEIYFWNDEAEQRDKYVNVTPDDFIDTEDFLDFLRWKPAELDRFFTHLTTIEEENQFFGPGEFIGFGFSFVLDDFLAELVITQVFAGSPAEAAGFARGLQIIEIDGRTIAEIVVAEDIAEAFGESELGITIDFKLQAPGGQPFLTTATKDTVTIDPVPQHKIIDIGGRKIGYIEFRTFISTAPAAIQNAFADFKAQDIKDVIVDVRYNGGGLVSIAEYFASLLAGPANIGRVLSNTRFNLSNGHLNSTATVSSETNSINLDSIVFITSESSASATELVINALEPYLDVALVGERTFGKPVGQTLKDFCEQRLRLVTFETLNADQQGGYFDGIAVDCPATDDLAFALGDEFEDSLATALTRVVTSACPIMGIRGDAALQSVDEQPARTQIDSRSAAREFSYAY